MNPKLQATLDQAVSASRRELAENLYSCCVYGSAVRGNVVEGVSEINLLIVLNQFDSKAHRAIARVVGLLPRIDPFVLAKRGFERGVRAFVPKFARTCWTFPSFVDAEGQACRPCYIDGAPASRDLDASDSVGLEIHFGGRGKILEIGGGEDFLQVELLFAFRENK